MKSIHDKLDLELQKTLLWQILLFEVKEDGLIYDASGNNIIERRVIKTNRDLSTLHGIIMYKCDQTALISINDFKEQVTQLFKTQ